LANSKPWYALTIEESLTELQVKENEGITQQEAKNRLTQYGPNELKKEKGKSPIKLFLGQFTDVLMIILLIATGLSIAVGEQVDAIIILIIVFASAILGFTQEYRSEKAVEALKKMTSPTALVIRDGKETKIQASEIVPGDILLLYAGDKVPADARLIEAHTLKVEEAALTGESTAVDKETQALSDKAQLNDRRNMVYTGTSIALGRAKALVTETGMRTEFGKIAQMVQTTAVEETPLEKRLASVGKWIGLLAIVVASSVAVVGVVIEIGRAHV
jgi:Ca2+-transporting ATPase